jgi:hypothetical protein
MYLLCAAFLAGQFYLLIPLGEVVLIVLQPFIAKVKEIQIEQGKGRFCQGVDVGGRGCPFPVIDLLLNLDLLLILLCPLFHVDLLHLDEFHLVLETVVLFR